MGDKMATPSRITPKRSILTPLSKLLQRLRDKLNISRLQTRLLVLISILSIIVLASSVGIFYNRASRSITTLSEDELAKINNGLGTTVSVWLKLNVESLTGLAAMPEIASMNADQQRSVMASMDTNFEHIYLIHTIGPDGMNVARSDANKNTNYADRQYFKSAFAGEPLVFESLIGKTTKMPALIIAAPIRDLNQKIEGVASFAIDLTELSKNILIGKVGNTGFSYLIDASNRVLAHPDSAYTTELRDMSVYSPVAFLRSGGRGLYEFKDETGRSWISYVSELDYGWGVVVQQEKDELLAALQPVRTTSYLILIIGLLGLLLISGFLIQNSLRPIRELTEAAAAVAGGDLTRQVSITRKDETGELAASFNTMTSRLQSMVGSLEQQVAERTRGIELSADISRRLSIILDPVQLVSEVVELLQFAFNYYHTQIYLFDESGDNLMMVGGTGEAGKTMLERGHKLARGQGLVGRAAESGTVVLVQDTHADPQWVPNQLLPDTKSEIAVPIVLGDQVLGALDVQQNEVGGLGQQDSDLLSAVANQVAIALRNARQFAETNQNMAQQTRVTDIIRQIQNTTSVESALQVAAREIGRALSAQRTKAQLGISIDNNGKN